MFDGEQTRTMLGKAAVRKPDSIPIKVRQLLETGAELTADEISRAIGGAQIDVVRRALDSRARTDPNADLAPAAEGRDDLAIDPGGLPDSGREKRSTLVNMQENCYITTHASSVFPA
jgi:hypothetical protein